MRVNVFMFLSLFFSVTSALASTLLRQWAREYLQYSRPSAAPHKRGRVRAYLFDGLSQSQIRRLSYAVPVLFHLAVFLFFYALSEWLYSVNVPVGAKARHCLVALLAIYFGLSVLPLIVRNTPYQTALTIPLQACVSLIRALYLGLYQYVRCSSGVHEGQEGSGVFESANINRDRVLIEDIKSKASNPDRSAMHWLLNEIDEDNMDNFLSGLPGYLRSPLTDTKVVVEGLIEDGLPERIREHITTCVTSAKLSQEESMSRAVACINSLRLISKTAANTAIQRPGLGNDIQAIMECLEPLCYNPFTSLRALCIRGLVIREFPIPPPPLRAESEGADVTDSDEEGARARMLFVNRDAIPQVSLIRLPVVVTLTESQIEPARNSASVLKNQKRTPKRSRTTNAFASTSATGSGSKATKKGTRAPPKKKAVLENIRIPDDEVLSYEQKKDLSEAIRTLDEQKLARVNEIIYEGLPETRDVRFLSPQVIFYP